MIKNKHQKIPVFDIEIGKDEKRLINECLDKNNIGQGSFVSALENEFSNYVGCKYGVSTTSGTTALHLARKTIGIDKGDQVLISSSTNMARPFSVIYCGGVPIPVG